VTTRDNVGGLDRREFLRRGAVGGAVAGGLWVAPSVLTLDAAQACGTVNCTARTTWSWIDPVPPGNNGYGVNFVATRAAGPPPTFSMAARTEDSVTLTPSGTDTSSQIELSSGVYQWRTRNTGESGWHLWQSRQLPAGSDPPTVSSFLKTRMGSSGVPGASHTIRLTFSPSVRDLTFSILDIDAKIESFPYPADNYRDVVTVRGNSGEVPFQILYQGTAVTGDGTPESPFYGNATGSGSPGGFVPDTESSATNTGNVTICFLSPVTTVDIQHGRGYSTAPPDTSGTALVGGQHIGISDLTWCTNPAPGT
jgi:hypothetical protein